MSNNLKIKEVTKFVTSDDQEFAFEADATAHQEVVDLAEQLSLGMDLEDSFDRIPPTEWMILANWLLCNYEMKLKKKELPRPSIGL